MAKNLKIGTLKIFQLYGIIGYGKYKGKYKGKT